MRTDAVALDARRRAGLRWAMATAVISGFAVWVNGHAVGRFESPTTYTTAKNLVAAALLGGLLVAATARGRAGGAADTGAGFTRPTSARQWVGLGVVGVLGGGIAFVLFFEGLASATSTDAAFIHKTLVVWVGLLAVPVLRERIGPVHLAAIGLLLTGQALLVGGVGLAAGSGGMLMLAATWCWAVDVVVARRLLLDDLSPLTVGTARMGVGVVVLLVWSSANGVGIGSLGVAEWPWALLTGAILTGYVATWYQALARAPAVDVTAVLVPAAAATAVLAAVFDGVPLRPDAVALGLLIAGAAMIVVAGGSDESVESVEAVDDT